MSSTDTSNESYDLKQTTDTQSVSKVQTSLKQVEEKLSEWNENLKQVDQIKYTADKLKKERDYVLDSMKRLKQKETQNNNLLLLLGQQKDNWEDKANEIAVELEKMKATQNEIENSNRQLRNSNNELNKELQNLFEQLSIHQQQKLKIDSELNKLQFDMSILKKENESIVTQSKLYENRMSAYENQNQLLSQKIQQLNAPVEKIQIDKQNYSNQKWLLAEDTWKTLVDMYVNGKSQFQLRQYAELYLGPQTPIYDSIQKMYAFFVRQFLFDENVNNNGIGPNRFTIERGELNEKVQFAHVLLYLRKHKEQAITSFVSGVKENELTNFNDLVKSFVPDISIL